MTYILFIFFIHGTDSRLMTVTQEFNSEKACLVAAAEVRGAYNASNDTAHFRAICLSKG